MNWCIGLWFWYVIDTHTYVLHTHLWQKHPKLIIFIAAAIAIHRCSSSHKNNFGGSSSSWPSWKTISSAWTFRLAALPLFVNVFIWTDEFVHLVLISITLLLRCDYALVSLPNMVMSITSCLSSINWMLLLYSLLFWLYFVTFCSSGNKRYLLQLYSFQKLY